MTIFDELALSDQEPTPGARQLTSEKLDRARLDVQTDGSTWTDLHAMPEDLDTAALLPMEFRAIRSAGNLHTWRRQERKLHERVTAGPNRRLRALAYRTRVARLPHLLESTGGTGNPMVNLCRSGTEQSARDKTLRLKGGDGQTSPLSPDARLRTYGMRVELAAAPLSGYRIVGGTARQRACYLRAVERHVL